MRTPRNKRPAAKAVGAKSPAASPRSRARKKAAKVAKPAVHTSVVPAVFAENRAAIDAMANVASRFKAWRPALDVCTVIRAVPSIFVQIDRIMRVGGWPTQRIALLHGPSNEGKTALALGIIMSFLRRMHFASLVDAERTTPAPWLHSMMHEYAGHPGFTALRPRTYEETVDAVRQWCETIGEARAKGEIHPDTSGVVVVDSLRKLVPKRLLDTLLKEGAEQKGDNGGRRQKAKGVDGFGGRAAQFKAALNAAWVDELIPLLGDTGTCIVLIAREAENPDAAEFGAEDFRVGGGKAVNYDSSVVLRVLRDGWVRDINSDGEVRDVGERHVVELRKTKLAFKEERVPTAHFYTSNGVLVPPGFDRPRDVLELAKDEGVVTLAGNWFAFGKTRLGQGESNSVRRLHAEPALCDRLEAALRERFVIESVPTNSPTVPPPAPEAAATPA